MKNWKRILAAAGTAALLVSNLGSVTQAVFATEDPTEEVRTPGEAEESEETTPDVDLQSAASEAPVSEESAESTGEPGKELPEGSDDGTGEGADGETTGSGSESNGSAETGGRNDGGSAAGSEASESTAQGTGASDGTGSGTANAEGSAQSKEKSEDTGNESAESTASGNGDGESHNTANGTGESTGTDKGSAAANGTEGSGATADEPAGSAEDGEVIPGPTEGGETSEAGDTSGDEESEDEDDEQEVYDLKDSLTISLETKESKKCDPARNDDGVYLYNLGETASTTIKIANPEAYTLEESDDAVVRLYMRFTDIAAEDDEDTETTVTTANIRTKRPGKYTIEAEDGTEYDYTVYEVEDGLYCYEIERPINADTISLEVTSVYSDSSDDDNNTLGGENQIWVVSLTEEEAATLDGIELVDDEDAESVDESDEESQDDAETTDEDAEASDKDNDADSEEQSDTDADNDDQDAEDTSDDADAAEQDDEEAVDSEDDADKDSDDVSDADADKDDADKADDSESDKDTDDADGSKSSDEVDEKESDRKSDDRKDTDKREADEEADASASRKANRSATNRSDRETIGVAKVPDDDAYVDILRWERDVKSEIRVQTAETENYIVSVAYGPEANIPEDAELRVIEYDEDSEEYKEASEQAGDVFIWLLDIALYDGDEEVEPEQSISISVTPKAAAQTLDAEDSSAEDNETPVTEQKARDQVAELLQPAENNAEPEIVDGVDTSSYDYIFANANMAHFTDKGVEAAISEVDGETYTFTTDSLSPFGRLNGGIEMEWTQPENEGIMLTADEASNATQKEPTYTTEATSSQKADITTDIDDVDGDGVKDIEDDYYAEYASDKATSDINSIFTGISDQDGKLMTDKSVIYMHDDYNAIANYEDGEFGITLSALGQEYTITEEERYITPIDVVFILDVSGSMKANTSEGMTRREALVSAVNSAMKSIFEKNENNRVGIALYSSGASTLLNIDRYTGVGSGDNTRYIELSTGGLGQVGNSGDVRTVSGLKAGEETVRQTASNLTQQQGTYTQAGIKLGADLFNAADTTVKVETTKGKEIEVKRQPVFILLSDGDPTHATSDYANVNPTRAYGNGAGADTNNNKGILGYYTILSANYYKGAVGEHYGKTAQFYTIGEGIYQEGYNNMSGNSMSITGDHYKRAVLNPDTTNVNYLQTEGTRRDPVQNRDTTALMLYQLLNGTYTGDAVSVGAEMNNSDKVGDLTIIREWVNQGWGRGYYASNIPVISPNPYKDDYSYADGSYFGDLGAAGLTEVFKSIIEHSQTTETHQFATANGTGVQFQDFTGEYMEIKGAPILRFGKTNYEATRKSDDGKGTVTYTYSERPTYKEAYPENYAADGSGNTSDTHHAADDVLDLSEILVQITTNNNGTQEFYAEVPDELLPVLYPSDDKSFYFRESPIRFIYKVGLTKAGAEAVNALQPGESLTCYTNQWSPTKRGPVEAFVLIGSTVDEEGNEVQIANPYQFNDAYGQGATPTLRKEENTTGTREDYFYEFNFTLGDPSEETLARIPIQVLGNNGKLRFTRKYELPSTGGLGTLPLELGGSAALLTSMFVSYSRRRRHRKEGEM